MTTDHTLEQRILGPRLRLPISKERYDELAHARTVLSEALTFEQRYELLLGNFISMELALTEIGLRSRIERQFQYSKLSWNLEAVNRHVVNFLTATRGYADQVLQDFKCLELKPSFGSVAKDELGTVFKRSSDYRFIYSLRNHVQHKATAVHGFEGNDAGHCDANSWTETVTFLQPRLLSVPTRTSRLASWPNNPKKLTFAVALGEACTSWDWRILHYGRRLKSM